jgi:hypothetical protein
MWDFPDHIFKRGRIVENNVVFDLHSRLTFDQFTGGSNLEFAQSILCPFELRGVPMLEDDLSPIAQKILSCLPIGDDIFFIDNPIFPPSMPGEYLSAKNGPDLWHVISSELLFSYCYIAFSQNMDFLLSSQYSEFCVLCMKQEMYPRVFGMDFNDYLQMRFTVNREDFMGTEIKSLENMISHFSWQLEKGQPPYTHLRTSD